MIVVKNKTLFREFLESLKVPSAPRMKGGTIFSPDEINYLTRYSTPLVYEFIQENETDREFYEMFVKWLHEEMPVYGYVDVYMVVYLRYGQYLSNDEFEYLERNVPECFEKGHVWLYEINYRRRFRLRIQLIRCLKKDFQRIIRKGIYKIDSTTNKL